MPDKPEITTEPIKFNLPELMLTPEDGTPQVSTANFYKMMLMHGFPVGAIHRISPQEKGLPRVHFSDIYFQDGAVHHFLGFECGQPTKENKPKIMGLIDSLTKIPFLAPYLFADDYVYTIGTPIAIAESEKCLKKTGKDPFVSINYIFRPPASICPKSIMESEGMVTLDTFVQRLAGDPHSILEEGNW